MTSNSVVKYSQEHRLFKEGRDAITEVYISESFLDSITNNVL